MAEFPAICPHRRRYTMGAIPVEVAPFPDGSLCRWQMGDHPSGVVLRLEWFDLESAERQQIEDHWHGQQGRFLPFGLPADPIWNGNTLYGSIHTATMEWRYTGPPRIGDESAGRADVAVELIGTETATTALAQVVGPSTALTLSEWIPEGYTVASRWSPVPRWTIIGRTDWRAFNSPRTAFSIPKPWIPYEEQPEPEVQEGDLELCLIAYRDTVTWTGPAGWTRDVQESNGNSNLTAAGGIPSVALFSRLVPAGYAAEGSLTFTSSGNTYASIARVIVRPSRGEPTFADATKTTNTTPGKTATASALTGNEGDLIVALLGSGAAYADGSGTFPVTYNHNPVLETDGWPEFTATDPGALQIREPWWNDFPPEPIPLAIVPGQWWVNEPGISFYVMGGLALGVMGADGSTGGITGEWPTQASFSFNTAHAIIAARYTA